MIKFISMALDGNTKQLVEKELDKGGNADFNNLPDDILFQDTSNINVPIFKDTIFVSFSQDNSTWKIQRKTLPTKWKQAIDKFAVGGHIKDVKVN